MIEKTIASYGAPYVDGLPVKDSESEMSAAIGNVVLTDLSQCTRTIERASVNFTTTAAAAPATLATAIIDHDTLWGSGSATRPVITKTATGRYTLTFVTPVTDEIGNVENVSFRRGVCDVMSSDPVDSCKAQILTIAANVVTIKVESPIGTLADVGDNSAAALEISVILR